MFNLRAPPRHKIYLLPGEIVTGREDLFISTLLGSCVSVCLWDIKRRIGGMNHSVIPFCGEGDEASTRYANVSTLFLYDVLRKKGCTKETLKASLYGGASGLGGNSTEHSVNVGGKNIEVTTRVLRKLKIPIIRKNVGGSRGRKIWFDIATGRVEMSYLDKYKYIEEEAKIML